MNITINKRFAAAIVIIAILTAAIFVIGSADGTTPGTEADPVVTQSYVEMTSQQIKTYIDSLIAKNSEEVTGLKLQLEQKNQEILKLQETVNGLKNSGGDAGFIVEKLPKGKTLFTGAGAELIVRSGKATAIKGEGGGLANITSGKDLKTGDAVVNNNLLISARDDGRGVKAVEECYLMIRGSYTIK